jgi:hypothetical protein
MWRSQRHEKRISVLPDDGRREHTQDSPALQLVLGCYAWGEIRTYLFNGRNAEDAVLLRLETFAPQSDHGILLDYLVSMIGPLCGGGVGVVDDVAGDQLEVA